jgi:hypothetical protein
MPKLSLPAKLDRFPPVVIRLLARSVEGPRVRALTDAEIAHRSGLSAGEIRLLSQLTSWEEVTLGHLLAFTRGCGANLDDRDWLRKNAAYMASIRGAPRYLRKSPDWERVFQPLIRTWIRHEQTKAA